MRTANLGRGHLFPLHARPLLHELVRCPRCVPPCSTGTRRRRGGIERRATHIATRCQRFDAFEIGCGPCRFRVGCLQLRLGTRQLLGARPARQLAFRTLCRRQPGISLRLVCGQRGDREQRQRVAGLHRVAFAHHHPYRTRRLHRTHVQLHHLKRSDRHIRSVGSGARHHGNEANEARFAEARFELHTWERERATRAYLNLRDSRLGINHGAYA